MSASSQAHRSSTQGLVGPSGTTDPQARLRFLLQLGAEENARVASLKTTTGGAVSPIQKKSRRLPNSIVGPVESEELPMVRIGWSRLVIGVTLADNRILGHCGSLPYEMRVRKDALAGLRYAFLLHLLVCNRFTDWLRPGGAETEPELNERIPTAAVALELSLTPWAKLPVRTPQITLHGGAQDGLGYDTFEEWREGILDWIPDRHSEFKVVHRDVTLLPTVPPGCILPDVDVTDVKWHVVDVDLDALVKWSQSIEAKAEKLFAWAMEYETTPGGSSETLERVVRDAGDFLKLQAWWEYEEKEEEEE
jgi:hypothetical protein